MTIAGPREVRAVSHEPPDANEFSVAYRELLEEFVRLAPSTQTGPPSWADALLGDPLRFPQELDRPELAETKQRFAVLLSRLTPADRDVYREIARFVLRSEYAQRSARASAPSQYTAVDRKSVV